MYDPKTNTYIFDAKEVAVVISLLKKVGYNERALNELKTSISRTKPGDYSPYSEYVHVIYNNPNELHDWIKKYPKGDIYSISKYFGASCFLHRHEDLMTD